MKREQIKQFAIMNGYEDIAKIGKWRGYDAYEPIMKVGEVSYIGLPLMILVKGDTIRMSTPEEGLEQIGASRLLKK